MTSDDALARRAAQGERKAFDAIYERYHQDLYRFCLAMVGEAQDAQDALQNTMVKVLRALPGEERQIRLKPWLYRIARNESVEVLRKRHDDVGLEQHEPAVAGLAETAETRERLRTLLSDLEQLPERQRAALVMRELSGLDYEQIGAAFDSSAAVARQTLYEARRSLHQIETGREMRCAEVMRELSDADGRITRRREIQAHLRSCTDCRAFRDGIAQRPRDLAALAPLPAAVSAGMLESVLGHGAAGGSAMGSGAVGAGVGKAVAVSAIGKAAATVAVVAVGLGAADRSGLIEIAPSGNGARGKQSVRSIRTSDDVVRAASVGLAAASGEGEGEQTNGGNAPGGGALDGSRATVASPGIDDSGSADGSGDSSRSRAGLSPPGGGHGRSAAAAHGPPEQLPQAAREGQEAATAHKAKQTTPPAAGSPPGKSPPPAGRPKARDEPRSLPPQTQAQPPESPAPNAEPAGRSGSAPGREGQAPRG